MSGHGSNMSGKCKRSTNDNVSEKFKSEMGSKIITELLALSLKSYSYKYCTEVLMTNAAVAAVANFDSCKLLLSLELAQLHPF